VPADTFRLRDSDVTKDTANRPAGTRRLGNRDPWVAQPF